MPDYSYNTVPNPNEGRDNTFRCRVDGDGRAVLKAGGRNVPVNVRETFGAGFTLAMKPKFAKRLRCGDRYELRYENRRIEVVARSFSAPIDGESRLNVGTVREYEPKERWAFRLPFCRGRRISMHYSDTHAAAYGGFVLVLFCVMALPGIGEALGTAPRIQSAIRMLQRNFVEVVHRVNK